MATGGCVPSQPFPAAAIVKSMLLLRYLQEG
jgi:hypothetical protein